jgi:hypothetical protein
MKKVLFVVLVLAAMTCLQAQNFAFQPSRLLGSNLWQNNVINPARLHMSHSMSFATVMGNNTSAYRSMYTNHLSYDFSSKLIMHVDLNFVNYGTASWKSNFNVKGNGDNQNRIVPEFSLEYKPSDKFQIHFEYKQAGYGQYDMFNPLWRQ